MTRVEFFMRGKSIVQKFKPGEEILIPEGAYAYIIHHKIFGTLFSPLHIVGEEISYNELSDSEKQSIRKDVRVARPVNGRLFPINRQFILN